MKLGGYSGRILRVDLSASEVCSTPLDEKAAYNYVGGRGLASFYLFNEQRPGVDPLGPESFLNIFPGPLAGTRLAGSERTSFVFKSPLTGTIFESSLGGFWGHELKKCGWDGVIISGVSGSPVYLLIDNGGAGIKEASDLWGMSSSETEEALRKKHVGGEVVEIGPAGEHLVRIASIMHRTRTAGRGGGGAVMGSKSLKAIVAKGEAVVYVADREAYERGERRLREILMKDPVTGIDGSLATFGTNAIIHRVNDASTLPADNFASSQLKFEEVDRFSGETVRERFFVAKSGCYRCPTACGRVITVDGVKKKGPEYETIAMFGADVGFHDFKHIARLSELCDELGLDTISAGNILAFALAVGHLEGRDIETAVKFLEDIAYGRSVFSHGLVHGARSLGREGDAMHVKGLEMPAYHPRGAFGMALNYATVPKGADHTSGYTIAPELFGHPAKVDATEANSKAHLVIRMQDAYAIYDSASLCIYHSIADFDDLEFTLDLVAALLIAVTGFKFDSEALHRAGSRIIDLERAFNRREGITHEADKLPPKLGINIRDALKEYYVERGWRDESET